MTTWTFVADRLREELTDYGELLRLLEHQQQQLYDRNADTVLRLATEMEAQVATLVQCRSRREEAVAAFAEQCGRPANTTLRALLPFVEPDARPLLEALVNEVNTLLRRVRRTSRHNHLQLTRAVEVHQEILQQLRPHAFTKTYSPAGRVSVAAADRTSTLSAAG